MRFVGITGNNRPEKFDLVIARRDRDVMMNAVNVVDRDTYAFEDVVCRHDGRRTSPW